MVGYGDEGGHVNVHVKEVGSRKYGDRHNEQFVEDVQDEQPNAQG